ncbi:MAG: glycine/sarcosine/betaine reductase selenoprotein B family protein [Anaerolineae bacterium]
MQMTVKRWMMAKIFRGDRWVKGETPWTPLPKPVSELRLALIGSGGVYHEDQEPFDAANREGDWSFRVIPGDAPPSALRVAHDHYNHKDGADKDINVVFPLDRLRELETRGDIGELSPAHIGFMGFIMRPEKIAEEMSPAVIRVLKEAAVEAALLVPA